MRSLLASLALSGSAAATNDPSQDYYTLETPHFRVHYPRTIEPVAEYTADVLEQVHQRLVPVLGHEPRDVTHVLITDSTESANGSATALPYNAVRLFATAPEDMSPLTDYDDWAVELTTHEYTHVLHTDNIHGLPALINLVLGKSSAPNQFQPRWILEGLAVLEESEHTSGGRNRSAIFDMFLRANVLEGRLAGLDRISHGPRRWPMGNFWYLYGSRFLTWIQHVYGEHAMRTVSADYGRQIIPFGINRSIQRATGRTYEQLYEGWSAHLGRLYGEQIAKAQALPGGLREGTRLTHHGRTTARPRWVPQPARRTAVPELLYYLDDGHHRTGFHRMFVPSSSEAWESDRDLWIRTVGEGSASFDRSGSLFFSSLEPHKIIYSYSDLFHLDVGKSSVDGDEPERVRLTQAQRAIDPDARFDGRQLTFAVNRRGTQYLCVADVSGEGTLGQARVLIPSARFQQAYTPRYSPDGRKIAYSSWSSGGFRDLRVADVATGQFAELTRDRAMDLHPSWSPDGKTIFFSSDRTGGIHNIYALDVATSELWMVTNVRTGAFMPEVAPDGRSMVYVGYTSDGYDLYGLDLDRSRWIAAPPYVSDRPDPPPAAPRHRWPRKPYNPLPTLRPFSYDLHYGPGTFGQTLTVTAAGQDIAGFHGIFASVTASTAKDAEPQFSLAYSYNRLPVDLGLTLFRSLAPAQQARINDQQPVYPEDYLGLWSSLSYTVPRAFDAFTFSASYTVSTYRARVGLGRTLDPQSQITVLPPYQGMLAVARFGFSYSNVERYLYSVGNSRGTNFSLSADVASRETGSDYEISAFSYALERYLQMPWHPDHTVELSARSGLASGNLGLRGAYYIGGYVDQPLLSRELTPNLFQGGFLLRGYPPNAYSGRQFHLGSIEYRAPLWYPERGISSLPLFFNRLSALGFIDYGGAFDNLDLRRWRDLFHTGYGGELLVDFTLGYFLAPAARFGYARGGSAEAYPGGKFYMILTGQL